MSTLGDFLQRQLSGATNRYDRVASMLALAQDLALVEPAEGLDHAERALELALHPYDAGAAGAAYCERGLCRLGLGDVNGAMSDLIEAGRMYKERGDDSGLVVVALAIGELRLYQNDYKRAIGQLEDGLAAAGRANEPHAMIAAVQALGNVYAAIGEEAKAREYYHDGVRRADELSARGAKGALLSDIAMLDMRRGDHAHALKYFREAAAHFDDPRYDRLVLRTIINIANALYATDDLEAAKLEAQRAWFIARSLNEPQLGLIVLSTLGNIMEKEGDARGALDQQQKALKALDDLRANGGTANRRLHVVLLLNIANLYRKLGDEDHAILLAQEMVQVAAGRGEQALLCRAHELLADMHEGRGEIERALWHQKQLNVFREASCNAERERIAAEMQARFDVERMQQERQRLEDALESIKDDSRSAAFWIFEQQGLINRIQQILNDNRKAATGAMLALIQELRKELQASKSALQECEKMLELWKLIDREHLKRLATLCPELSGQELIICELTMMGQSAGDIARIRHTSEDAPEQSRYRIRKKLKERGIDPGDDLAAFLAKM